MKRFASAVILATLSLVGLTLPALGSSLPPKPGPAASKYAAEYRKMNEPYWKNGFPNLGRFEVLAPATGGEKVKGAYNCIAHTLKIYNRWVWPGKRIADFDRLYGQHGYRRSGTLDYRFQASVEKIVLYAKVYRDGKLECTHGARQLADGTWTSKLGGGPLIRHATPAAVGGPSYGRPVAVYVRPRRTPVIAPTATAGAAKPSTPGSRR
jgi:hypothetical protein